jgi:hypothetical protein
MGSVSLLIAGGLLAALFLAPLAIGAGFVVYVLAGAMADALRWPDQRHAAPPAAGSLPLSVIRLRVQLADWNRAYTHPPGGVRCPECGRRMATRRGLADHRAAKHRP